MSKARDLANAGTALTSVSATELGYVDGVTSAIQTQLDAKLATATASSTYIPKTLTTTTGDIIYASGANTPARLGIGSSAQVLTVASGIPSWATPTTPVSKVVQIVTATYNSAVTIGSTSTVADTGLTATITPTSASNKVLVMVNQGGLGRDGADTYIQLRLSLANGSSSQLIGSQTLRTGASIPNYYIGFSLGYDYLDSPASTSALTYKTTFQNANAQGTVYVQSGGSYSSIVLMEVTP